MIRRETFVPQSYEWGNEARADFYKAYADLSGERQKLYVLSLRSMASGAAFHRAYRRPMQQAFLEAHEWPFKYFGAVFPRVRYDNLALAVKRILRGHQREETARFIHPASPRRPNEAQPVNRSAAEAPWFAVQARL